MGTTVAMDLPESLAGIRSPLSRLLRKVWRAEARGRIVGLGYVDLSWSKELDRTGFPLTGSDVEGRSCDLINSGNSCTVEVDDQLKGDVPHAAIPATDAALPGGTTVAQETRPEFGHQARKFSRVRLCYSDSADKMQTPVESDAHLVAQTLKTRVEISSILHKQEEQAPPAWPVIIRAGAAPQLCRLEQSAQLKASK